MIFFFKGNPWQATGRMLLLGWLFVALITPLRASAAGKTKQWEAALKPIAEMPVQDFGFIRSGYSFAENHLMAIIDKRSLKGQSPLLTVLRLMADSQAMTQTPLLKVTRPELDRLLGGKYISLAKWRDEATRGQLMKLVQGNQAEWMKPLNDLEARAQHLEEMEHDWAIVPQPPPKEWLSPLAVAQDPKASPQARQIAEQWSKLKDALRADDPQAGALAAQALVQSVNSAAHSDGVELPRLKLDTLYQRHQPFGKSAFFYLLAALAFGAALFLNRPWPARVGYALLVAGLAEQIFGIYLRWILAGRAPLSNMYESFTFAVAGMILLALVFESIWKNRLAGLGAGVLGFILMVLAHKLPIFDSQIRPLMPALQSSWLTYHVITIMLSYSAFALSFFLSVCYLAKDLAGGDRSTMPMVRRLPSLELMDVYNYRTIAVGFPLLTLGIILGAVWANTAWGRPWGFDPKETWSAITWLIYAIYLHVRFLAGWRGRRAALLALVGFACVLFTYFGVNYLLSGLHSYAV